VRWLRTALHARPQQQPRPLGPLARLSCCHWCTQRWGAHRWNPLLLLLLLLLGGPPAV